MQAEKSHSGLLSEIKDPAVIYDVTPPTHWALLYTHIVAFKNGRTPKWVVWTNEEWLHAKLSMNSIMVS